MGNRKGNRKPSSSRTTTYNSSFYADLFLMT